MSRTAYYPKPPFGTVLTTSLRHRRDGENVDIQLSPEESWAVLEPYFRGAEARDVNTFIGALSLAHFGPFELVETSPPAPIPQKIIDLPKIRSNNKARWAAAKRPGSIDIVVSNFARGQIKLTYGYGYKQVGPDLGYRTLSRDGVSCGLFPKGTMAGRVNIGGYKNCTFAVKSPYAKQRREATASPYQDGWNDDWLPKFIKSLSFSYDGGLITEVLADANTGMVDLLTTLAETPETMMSVFNGCRTILQMYKDARRGEVRLLNKAKVKRQELARLRARTRADFASIKEFERHQQRIRSAENFIKELVDATAGVWLTYRLEIYPTVKTIESTLDALGQLDRGFVRYRDTLVTSVPVPDFEDFKCSSKTMDILHRAFIKRGAREQDMAGLLFTANPFLTAWELVPLSFVLDRYISIGSLLAAFFGSPKISNDITEGSTYSWKIEQSLSWTHKTTGSTVSAEIGYYRRLVIDPNSFVCIPFPSERTRDHHLDHLALAWKLLLKNLWKV